MTAENLCNSSAESASLLGRATGVFQICVFQDILCAVELLSLFSLVLKILILRLL